MLPAKKRLNRTEFNRFFASGRRYHHPYFTLVYAPYPTFHGSVVVSKKIAPKAVDRNRLRRRAYEALRACWTKENQNGVYIVLLKAGVAAASSASFREALDGILGRIEEAR